MGTSEYRTKIGFEIYILRLGLEALREEQMQDAERTEFSNFGLPTEVALGVLGAVNKMAKKGLSLSKQLRASIKEDLEHRAGFRIDELPVPPGLRNRWATEYGDKSPANVRAEVICDDLEFFQGIVNHTDRSIKELNRTSTRPI